MRILQRRRLSLRGESHLLAEIRSAYQKLSSSHLLSKTGTQSDLAHNLVDRIQPKRFSFSDRLPSIRSLAAMWLVLLSLGSTGSTVADPGTASYKRDHADSRAALLRMPKPRIRQKKRTGSCLYRSNSGSVCRERELRNSEG